MELKTGDSLTLTTDEQYRESGDGNRVFIDYKNICKVTNQIALY